MLRAFIAVIAMLVASSMLTRNASPGILPCTGQSLIKVMDVHYPYGLEGRQVIRLRDQNVQLGYLFKGCFRGDWVGFVEEGKPHVPLNDQQLRALLFVSGMQELPPVPSYWSSPENHRHGLIWLSLGLIVIIAAAVRQMGILKPRESAPEFEGNIAIAGGSPAGSAMDFIPASYRAAVSAVEQAASEHTRVAVAGTLPPLRQPTRQASQGGQVPQFGKR